MITRYRVSLGGVQLDQLMSAVYPNAVVIHDITHHAPTFSRTIETPGSSDGGIITRTYRQSASVTVKFELRIYDTAVRKQVCDLIQSWAMNGGTLRTSDRKGQVLNNVICEELPEIGSAKNWTDELSVTFTNYSFPYWQIEDGYESILTLTGNNVDGMLNCKGNAENALVTATIEPTASTLKNFKIIVGSTNIELTGITVKPSQSARIGYDTSGNITISLYDRSRYVESLLSYRTDKSSDLLLAKCSRQWSLKAGSGGGAPEIVELGYNNAVNVTTNVRCKSTIVTRGAWM